MLDVRVTVLGIQLALAAALPRRQAQISFHSSKSVPARPTTSFRSVIKYVAV